MNKPDAIAAAKTFRQDADELLQRMKDHRQVMITQLNKNGERHELTPTFLASMNRMSCV